MTLTAGLPLLLAFAGSPQPDSAAVTRPIVGFVVLLALAYLAGHPRLANLEKRLALNPLATTGLVFVLLGMLASSGHVRILTESVVKAIGPIVPLGLGWIGFRIGFSYDRRLLANPPSGSSIFLPAAVPVVFMTLGCAALVLAVDPQKVLSESTVRDVLLLGIAGSMTSIAAVPLMMKARTGRDPSERIRDFVKLEQVAGAAGLMLVAAYFRPQGSVVAWQLPPIGWLFIALGVGVLMGALAHGLFRSAPQGPPFIVLLLGVVAMTAGMASFLRLAVIPVCAVAGMIVGGLSGERREQVHSVLVHMERPVFFVLLLVAGALWRPSEWQGWALMAVFVLSRLGGKWLAMRLIGRRSPEELSAEERGVLALAPIGAFSIAIVVTARDLYPDSRVPWMLTAAVGGAIVSELIVQLARRPRRET